MQRVTPGIGDAFRPVEKAPQETFLLALFEGLGEGAPERGVTRLPTKQADMALLDPKLMAPENSSQDTLSHFSEVRWSSGRQTTRPAS